jgi:uncharacterized membrane protein
MSGIKSAAWFVMTLLALVVASYAGAVAVGFRPPFTQAIFSAMPMVATAHSGGGAIALAAGALQLSRTVRSRFPVFHRSLGRCYVVAVTGAGVAALAMSIRSSGGATAHWGFTLLAITWIGTTLNAWRHIRAGHRVAHGDWMARSYALTFAAVTLRIYLPASQLAGIAFAVAYPIVSWLCWVPNLLAVECFILSRRRATVAA